MMFYDLVSLEVRCKSLKVTIMLEYLINSSRPFRHQCILLIKSSLREIARLIPLHYTQLNARVHSRESAQQNARLHD